MSEERALMPYIKPERREALATDYAAPINAGELTYQIQQLLKEYIELKGLRYAILAECLGSLEGAKIDLTERVLKPYEMQKCLDNGDVWPAALTRFGPELPEPASNAGPVIHQAYDPRNHDMVPVNIPKRERPN